MVEDLDIAPLPWKIPAKYGREIVVDAKGVTVADCAIMVHPQYGRRDEATNQAHAALCCAAPAMFHALTRLAAEADLSEEHQGLIAAAIRKAAGRTKHHGGNYVAEAKIKLIRQLDAEGKSHRQIAAAAKVAKGTVLRYVNKNREAVDV